MTQPLNFCRQMRKQFTKAIGEGRPKSSTEVMSHCIDLADTSQKFIMPNGGLIIEDKQFRALKDARLRLPYKFTALEYQRCDGHVINGETRSGKSIVFARERDDTIIVSSVAWFDDAGMWAPMPEIAIPCWDYWGEGTTEDGWQTFTFYMSDSRFPASDYQDEMCVLLSFLNALACSNVTVDRLNSVKRKLKPAIPFDEYHILTVDCPKRGLSSRGGLSGESRSPREHLRRGHIRRLEDGRKLWVNATVVNPGVGGKITKAYSVRDPRAAAFDASGS